MESDSFIPCQFWDELRNMTRVIKHHFYSDANDQLNNLGMIYEYFLDLYMDLPKFDLCVFPKYNIMSVPII